MSNVPRYRPGLTPLPPYAPHRPVTVREQATRKEDERLGFYFREGLRIASGLPAAKRLQLGFKLNPAAYTVGTLCTLALAVLAVAVALGVVTLS